MYHLQQGFGPSLELLSRLGELIPIVMLNHLLLQTGCFADCSPAGCRKENVQKASKWSESRLGQKASSLQPAIPVLDIPVDEDIQDRPSPQHSTSKQVFDPESCNSSCKNSSSKAFSTAPLFKSLTQLDGSILAYILQGCLQCRALCVSGWSALTVLHWMRDWCKIH